MHFPHSPCAFIVSKHIRPSVMFVPNARMTRRRVKDKNSLAIFRTSFSANASAPLASIYLLIKKGKKLQPFAFRLINPYFESNGCIYIVGREKAGNYYII
uniref:Uncharacterized protein n=1 Tax=Opuntia streptacantha TaxID=393608 RepID=A0A7C9A786_OPUST